MKNILAIVIILIGFWSLQAQKNYLAKYTIGGYYVAISNPNIMDKKGEVYKLWEHYINIHANYHITRQWRTGAEFNYVTIKGRYVDNPYFISGISMDYDVIKSEKIGFYLRAGLSLANLSFASDTEPIKRMVLNRIIGVSTEFKLYKFVDLCVGYFNHFPLNKIRYKYGIAHPVIGLNVRF